MLVLGERGPSTPVKFALGAAGMARVGAGEISLDDLAALGESGERIDPAPESAGRRDREYAEWRWFVERIAAVED